jgi:peptide/nickel transport system substrate-binding protein
MHDDHEEGFRKFEAFLKEWDRREFLRNSGAALAWTAFAAGGVEFLNACLNAGQSGNQPPAGIQPKKGGHIVEGTTSDIKGVNSVLISDTASAAVGDMLNDGLLTVNEKGDLVPTIAKEVPKVSSDSLTYTFKLRQDVKWSDGSDLTSDDVLFTYNLMFDPAYKEVNSPRRQDLETYVENISAPDKYTVVFKTKKVYAPFLSAQGQYGILPKKVLGSLAAKAINTADYNSNPTVTNGMYKFVKWDKGQQITLARNDKYYRGTIYPDNWVWKIHQSTEALNLLKTGELDIATVDNSQFDAAKAVDTINVLEYARLVFEFYMYNNDPAKAPSKMFSDKEVRQALLLGLDRQSLADKIYFKHATVANTSMPPKSWGYNPDNKPTYPFDKAKAESQLESAGWKKGADGIRAKGGVRLDFSIQTNVGNKVRENLTAAMADMWSQIGVKCTPKYVDFNQVLVPQITNVRTFEALMVGFQWGIDPDQSPLWHSRNTNPGGFNGFSYKSDAMDKILDDAVGTLDKTKRKDLYFQMQKQLAQDQPAPILLFSNALVGVNKRIVNFSPSTFTARRMFALNTFAADQK